MKCIRLPLVCRYFLSGCNLPAKEFVIERAEIRIYLRFRVLLNPGIVTGDCLPYVVWNVLNFTGLWVLYRLHLQSTARSIVSARPC